MIPQNDTYIKENTKTLIIRGKLLKKESIVNLILMFYFESNLKIIRILRILNL